MARPRKQEGGHNISVTVYTDHDRMAAALVEQGFYANVSDVVRNGIAKMYAEKIGNTEEQLLREKARLEEVCKNLETLQKHSENKLDKLINDYRNRRKNLSMKGISTYKGTTKKWIEENLDSIATLFPQESVDEIYEDLEEMIKVKK